MSVSYDTTVNTPIYLNVAYKSSLNKLYQKRIQTNFELLPLDQLCASDLQQFMRLDLERERTYHLSCAQPSRRNCLLRVGPATGR
jgi:hypothetical protein